MLNTDADKVFVVGSGPSGVAAAHALLEQGVTVCMLDVGLTLEPERRQQVADASTSGGAAEVLTLIEDGAFDLTGPTNFYRKLADGSDFAYRGANAFVASRSGLHEIHSSFALGGLSNVWGAAVLPFSDDDIRDWPLDPGELVPHYQAVQSFMHLAGTDDPLSGPFPFFADPVRPFDLSSNAESFLTALNSRKEAMANGGIYTGRSRIAVGSGYPSDRGASFLPDLFIGGVTNGATFNAAEVVDDLKRHPRFEYVSDVTVTGFEENADGVQVFAGRGNDDKVQVFEGRRLFLAAGVLPTARIVLSSLKAYERAVPLKQSMHFIFPILHVFPGPSSPNDNAFSLAEIFIAFQDTAETGYWSFLSIYRLSEFLLYRIRERYGPLAAGIRLLDKIPLFNQFVCQGYLHSALSPDMTLVLEREADGKEGKIRVTTRSHSEAKKTTRRLVRKFSRKVWRSGIFPIAAAIDANVPGRGNHVGGTFPMREQPSDLECDKLGRPNGLSRVHIVDASVLPSIPATTITFGVMANAYRIAKASCTL